MSVYILSNNENIVKSVRRADIPADYIGPVVAVSDGNKKLKSTNGMTKEDGTYIPSTKWLIFNIPAVFTCPFRTRMCGGYLRGEKRYEVDPVTGKTVDKKADCYAVKAESAYPTVIPARKDNFRATLMLEFVDMMTAIILRTAKNMKKERLIVRIHESGDFYTKHYAELWLQIARNCAHDTRIVFWAYTKSFPFFDGVELPENFRLRASFWDDTKPEQKEIAIRNNWPVFYAVDKFSNDGSHHCRCANCADCNACGDMSIHTITCEKH